MDRAQSATAPLCRRFSFDSLQRVGSVWPRVRPFWTTLEPVFVGHALSEPFRTAGVGWALIGHAPLDPCWPACRDPGSGVGRTPTLARPGHRLCVLASGKRYHPAIPPRWVRGLSGHPTRRQHGTSYLRANQPLPRPCAGRPARRHRATKRQNAAVDVLGPADHGRLRPAGQRLRSRWASPIETLMHYFPSGAASNFLYIEGLTWITLEGRAPCHEPAETKLAF